MKSRLGLAIAAFALLAAARPVVAHHGFAAEYDADKPVILKGRVTKIEWINPHARVSIDVKDEKDHTVTSWTLELASPKVLVTQCGWKVNSLHIDDEVTVDGAMAKDGSKKANARIVTLADGRRVSAGSSSGDVPPR